jgi:hypothetical protein
MPSTNFRDGMAQARIGAWRHYGRKYAFWFVFGPIIGKLLGVAVVLAGVYVVGWVLIPHWVLGSVALALASAGVLALVGPVLRRTTTRARINARAQGRSVRPARLGLAYGLLVLACVGMGWLALWSPYA